MTRRQRGDTLVSAPSDKYIPGITQALQCRGLPLSLATDKFVLKVADGGLDRRVSARLRITFDRLAHQIGKLVGLEMFERWEGGQIRHAVLANDPIRLRMGVLRPIGSIIYC